MTGRYRDGLDSGPTVAEVLKKAGYRTAMTGKWHLGKEDQSPFHRGFEDFYGTLEGGGSYWDPPSLTRNDQPAKPDSPDFYYTDRIGAEAARQIRESAKSDRPFFHYVAFTAPHWPMHAPEATIRKYLDRYRDGWPALRRKRYARMLEMGLIDRERWPMSPPEPGVRDWESLPNKDWHVRNMAVYAAMVDHLDQAVGKVVAALEETGRLDNTLLLFCSDNGACSEHLGGNGWNTAVNVLEKAKREGRTITIGDDPSVPNGGPETFGSVGRDWANAQNTPLPRYKANVRAGGTLTPAIFHWPARIPADQRGKLTSQRGHVVDFMATACELAGTEAPTNRGRTLVPMLTGGKLDDDFPYYFNHQGTHAIIRGKFKLVQERKGPWQLFDLSKDKTESHDLAAEHPGLVEELKALWESFPPPGR
jgi:arylsulfatase